MTVSLTSVTMQSISTDIPKAVQLTDISTCSLLEMTHTMLNGMSTKQIVENTFRKLFRVNYPIRLYRFVPCMCINLLRVVCHTFKLPLGRRCHMRMWKRQKLCKLNALERKMEVTLRECTQVQLDCRAKDKELQVVKNLTKAYLHVCKPLQMKVRSRNCSKRSSIHWPCATFTSSIKSCWRSSRSRLS